jgi:hypothetical protein
MMSAEGVALLHRWMEEVWNNPREGAIEELFASDGIAHGLSGPDLRGPPEFKQYVQLMRGAFSKIHVSLDEAFQHGEMVAARQTVEMVFRKTGKTARIQGAGFIRVRAGKIQEAWNYYDFLDLAVQLGAVAPDALQKLLMG